MSIHPHISHNGRILPASEPCLRPGQLGLLSGWGVFTTLRVVDEALFAWERHWARMSRDAVLLNVEMPEDRDAVEQDLIALIQANGTPDCTLRLVVVRNEKGFWAGGGSGRASDTIALTADSNAWGESVRLGVQANARHSASDFTRAKILSWAENLRWAERAQEQGFDEVVLLNEFNHVTECTSANIFAVYDETVCTPPLGDGCLPGITRELLLGEIRLPEIHLMEDQLTLGRLEAADEVFITSTTRGLLPVRQIDGRKLRSDGKRPGGVCDRLSHAFDLYVEKDISGRKRPDAVR